MNEISDDDEEPGLLDNATARDSLALQAYLRERKLGCSKSDNFSTPSGPRSASSGPRNTMNIEELDNTLTVLSPGLQVRTSFSATRGISPKKSSRESPARSQFSPSKRFDEGGGVFIEDSTRSLRSLVKQSQQEKNAYQQTILEKQKEVESLKEGYNDMFARCEKFKMQLDRSKRVSLPSRVAFMLERWGTRSMYNSFHRWRNTVSDYSTSAMKKKEDMMNRERQDWLTVRAQWARKRGELSSAILARTVRGMVNTRLSKGFRKWYSTVYIDMSCSLVKELWIAPINDKSRMRVTYSRWKKLLVEKKFAYKTWFKVVSRMCFRSVLAAWNSWKAHNRNMDIQKQKFLRAMSIINTSSPYAHCLEKWRHYAFISEPKRLRLYSLLCSSANLKSRAEQRKYFNSWRVTSKNLGLVPGRVSGGLKRFRNMLTKNYFHKWSKSSKRVAKIHFALASLTRCAKESTHSTKQSSFSHWYRVSTQAQIADLQRQLSEYKNELSSCRSMIDDLNDSVGCAKRTTTAQYEAFTDTLKKSVLRRIVLLTTRQATAKYFSIWRLHSVKSSAQLEARRSKLLQDVTTRMIVCGAGKVSTAFRVWGFHVQKKIRTESDLKRCAVIVKLSIRRSYFSHWALVAAAERRSEVSEQKASQKMMRVAMRLSKLQLAKGMLKWKSWLNEYNDKRSGAYYVKRIIANGSVRQFFAKWKCTVNAMVRREYEDYRAMTRQKAKTHAVSMLRRLLFTPVAVFMAEWKDYVRVMKLSRRTVRRMCMTRQTKLVQNAFLTWRCNVSQMNKFGKSTELLTRAFAKYFYDATHSAFLVWKEFSRRKKDFDGYSSKLFELESKLKQGEDAQAWLQADGRDKLAASAVFQAWKQVVHRSLAESATKGRIMKSCIVRIQKREVVMAFKHWVGKIKTILRLERTMKRSLTRFIYQKLDVAMKTWSRNVFAISQDNQIGYLKHCNELHISKLEGDNLMQKVFQKWSRYTTAVSKNKSTLKRCVKRMSSVQLSRGFLTWKSTVHTEKKMSKFIRFMLYSKLRIALFTWKVHCSGVARSSVIMRLLRRKQSSNLHMAWKKWYANVKSQKKTLRLLENVVRHCLGTSKLRVSTAFYRFRVATAMISKREGYFERSHNLHMIRGGLKNMRKAFDGWKMYTSTALKARGIEIMGYLEKMLPIINRFSEVLNSEADANMADTVMLMDGEYENTYSCWDELHRISEEMKNSVQVLLPEFNCSVYVFDPESQYLVGPDPNIGTQYHSPNVAKSPLGVSPKRNSPAGHSVLAGSFRSPSLREPGSFAMSPNDAGRHSRTPTFSQSPSKPMSSVQPQRSGFQSSPLSHTFHSLHDFDDGASVGPAPSPPSHDIRESGGGWHYIEVGPGGGDVGLCAQTGAHLVRRSLVSEALLFCNSQRGNANSRQSSPERQPSSPAVYSGTPPRGSDRLASSSGIFGRSLSKCVSFGFESAYDPNYDEEDDYIYAAVVPISWNGEVVGVLRLRSSYLSSPHMSSLSASGFDVLGRPECVLGNTEKQSWFLFSKSIEAATMQVYPVCLKLELDVERACGLDTAVQLGGWALRTAIEKNRRKKMLQNQFLMNPPGPTRKELLSQLEEDKMRMHDEIQELAAKLHQSGASVDRVTEKSAKYKKFAENWKRRSERLQAELEQANEKIKYLTNKYGDVKRIHDSLQRVTEDAFANGYDSDQNGSLFGTPTT